MYGLKHLKLGYRNFSIVYPKVFLLFAFGHDSTFQIFKLTDIFTHHWNG